MKKLFLLVSSVLGLVSCAFTPDGIDADAFAPYSPVSHTLQCNTGRGLGVSSFSAGNSCLYYEFEGRDDDNAAGFYQRVSEEKAHVIIRSDDAYEVEYILTFTSPSEGTVEEKYTVNDFTETFTGKFHLH